ncbi:phosphatase PAP2 family protein [Candidatus Saccharibacteria bacterium]|nr:phosphatase PAP2 family protein [Candidatus Saccharibacteria bacterium]
MQWDLITNIILISSLLTLATFAIVALVQWINRKSFMKIDRVLRWIPLPLALMTIVYFIFDKLIILNTRPDGSGEPSFPSTHVMVVTTIFFIVITILPKYIHSKVARVILDILMAILISLTCTGRVLANMHWPIDVFGGVAFAIIFTEIYYIVAKTKKKEKK